MKRGLVVLMAMLALTLAGCGTGVLPTPTPSPFMPDDVTPSAPPDHVRRDLGDGIVAAKDEYGDGRAVYVTHVPSGAQVVLDGEGVELERHDGEGMAAIEAALAEDGMRGDLGSMLDQPGPERGNCTADFFFPSFHFGGAHYVPAMRSAAAHTDGSIEVYQYIPDDLLADVFARVAFRGDCNDTGMGYQSQDGDAVGLTPGTPVYAVRGYDPSFRLAVVGEQGATLYEATDNPSAKVGADLLDIGGKVTAIDVLGERDASTVLGTIDDARTVEQAVEFVLSAPVTHGDTGSDKERYFLRFRLSDGTSVVRAFWPETGELHRGIMTDPALAIVVLWTLPEDYRPPQTWEGPRITEDVAVRVALGVLGSRTPDVQAPDRTEARLMTLGEAGAIRGASYGEAIDTSAPVWFVEFAGSFRDSGPGSAGDTFRYAVAIVDAGSGRIHGIGHSSSSALDRSGTSPTATPTLTPTPTEAH